MKLNLQYTTAAQKEHIIGAASIKDGHEAIRKGWVHIGEGLYKTAYRKSNIVLKLNNGTDPDHMLNEIEFYRRTPKYYKQFLASVYGGDGRRIIQKFVKSKPTIYTDQECDRIYYIGGIINMEDYDDDWNVCITKDNKIQFYDFAGHYQGI